MQGKATWFTLKTHLLKVLPSATLHRCVINTFIITENSYTLHAFKESKMTLTTRHEHLKKLASLNSSCSRNSWGFVKRVIYSSKELSWHAHLVCPATALPHTWCSWWSDTRPLQNSDIEESPNSTQQPNAPYSSALRSTCRRGHRTHDTERGRYGGRDAEEGVEGVGKWRYMGGETVRGRF